MFEIIVVWNDDATNIILVCAIKQQTIVQSITMHASAKELWKFLALPIRLITEVINQQTSFLVCFVRLTYLSYE
ncbi:hypothetical protein D7Y13_42020 [Corallococcus praedator]|uniref:Uncharacterized protein n=1 Tax=Corallococcus praedator TaxID=2316724 RepID=A0ABX9Q4H2_9BACT|nr:hypothetical protein D7Y13_42020 [Corallococcus praedator]